MADETLPHRVVGWYRPDLAKRIWLVLPACVVLTAIGALLVGYGYGRLERADPVGLHRDARAAQAERWDEPELAPHERGAGQEPLTMWLFFGCGLLLVASGPALTIVALRRIWRHDDFLLLRTDALISSVDGRETAIAWDAMESIRFDAERAEVAIELREGGRRVVEPRLVDDGEKLARHLEEVRRKAIWSLLPQQRS